MREVPVPIVSATHDAPRMSRRMDVLLTVAIAVALLIPCVWQEHIEAGDLASHLYNAWLAGQIQNGTIAGLTVGHPLTNVLSDGIMAALIGPLGPAWTARLVCAVAGDATCCRIMGLNLQRIGYLQLAAGRKRLREDPVPQIAEPLHAVRTRFAVPQELERLRLPGGGQKS